ALNKTADPASTAQNWWVNNGSWLMYIASLLLFALAFVVWELTTTPPIEGPDPGEAVSSEQKRVSSEQPAASSEPTTAVAALPLLATAPASGNGSHELSDESQAQPGAEEQSSTEYRVPSTEPANESLYSSEAQSSVESTLEVPEHQTVAAEHQEPKEAAQVQIPSGTDSSESQLSEGVGQHPNGENPTVDYAGLPVSGAPSGDGMTTNGDREPETGVADQAQPVPAYGAPQSSQPPHGAVAGLFTRSAAERARDRLPRALDWLIILGLFAVALYLRVRDLDTIPPGFWFDEAQNGMVGRQLVAPGAFHPVFIADLTQMGALYFYFVGLAVKFLGIMIWPTRILPALGGALIAPMVYVLASRLYGWRSGLAAAGLVTVSAWNITMSRFGMASLPTVALDVAVYLCVAQALRTGRLGYYAAGGVLLGLAEHMYYPSRLLPVVLGAVFVHRLFTERMRLIRSVRAGIPVLVLGAVLAFIPMGLFAVQRPEIYNSRTDIVSVFSPMNSPNQDALRQNLEHNIRAHALMFEWQGDGNGRHNLPGAPLLDWVTNALFVAGLASCLVRAWRWQYFFPIVWGLAAISGGVFSLPFEAPQSHRTLENSVVTALIAGIFLGEVATALVGGVMVNRLINLFTFRSRRRDAAVVATGARPPARRPIRWPMRLAWAISGAALLLALYWIGGINIHRYFDVQAQDMSVWQDMYSPQAQTARMIQKYGQDHDIYVTPVYKDAPPSGFLVPDIQTQVWPGMQAIPLSTGANKPGGIVIILDEPSAADVATMARIYPHATFEITTAPNRPEPLLYTIVIPASDIQALHGVHLTLTEPGGKAPKEDKSVPEFAYDWGASPIKNGTARMSSTIKVDTYGVYRFNLKGAEGSQGPREFRVDGYSLLSGQPITLGLGLHSVVATDTVASGSGISQLTWSVPGGAQESLPPTNLFDPRHIEPRGLTGIQRAGVSFETPPTTARVDPVISFYFHQTLLPRPYTVEWLGKLYAPEDGTYVLGTEQLSTSRVFLDGKEIINNTAINNLMESSQNLTAGWHDMRILYTDLDQASHIYLYWVPPGRPRSKIPAAFLFPQMGQYPDKPESGDLPTLEESDGTRLPEGRVTYWPPRTAQPAPPPEQPQAQPPPANQPPPLEEAPAKGEVLKPTFLIGDKTGPLPRPRSAAVDKAGNIYIYTEVDSKIHKFDPSGQETTSWDVRNGTGDKLAEGSDLIVYNDHVYLLDAQTSDIMGFSFDGQPAGNVHLCQCFFPRGIVLSKDGNFWIANTGGGRLDKVSPTGQAIRQYGEPGKDPGQFAEPAGVWESPQGMLYVADIANHRVQTFSADLNPVSQWPIGNSIARDGNRLVGDSSGNVLVTQYDDRAVVMYDQNGKELNRWTFRRNGAALVPAGITSLGDDKFLVLYPNEGIAAAFSTT
ncbi:MAG: PA14 domain-containing protein, partial [Chloroflexia bacterium]